MVGHETPDGRSVDGAPEKRRADVRAVKAAAAFALSPSRRRAVGVADKVSVGMQAFKKILASKITSLFCYSAHFYELRRVIVEYIYKLVCQVIEVILQWPQRCLVAKYAIFGEKRGA